MSGTVFERGGLRVLLLDVDGPVLAKPGDASDLVSAAWEHRADMVVLPVARIGADFFSLRTGLAGEVMQKLVNYRIRFAVLGDIAAQVAASTALRDFVYESNRGSHLWFVADRDDLDRRLDPAG